MMNMENEERIFMRYSTWLLSSNNSIPYLKYSRLGSERSPATNGNGIPDDAFVISATTSSLIVLVSGAAGRLQSPFASIVPFRCRQPSRESRDHELQAGNK